MQNEDRSLLVAQPFEQPIERLEAQPSLERILRGRGRVNRRRALLFIHQPRSPTRGTPVHQDHVDGDAVQPSREARLISKSIEAANDLKKDVLNQVFEIGPGSDHSIHEPGYVPAVPLKEQPERPLVAGPTTPDQLEILRLILCSHVRRHAFAGACLPMGRLSQWVYHTQPGP
jgi:hypothetical protein